VIRPPTDVLGRRVAAWLVDWLILSALYWGLFAVFAHKTTGHVSGSVFMKLTLGDNTYAVTGGRAGLFYLVWAVVGIGYSGVLPGVKGWTPGKLALGLRLVRPETGLPPGPARGIGRAFATIIDLFPYFIPMLVGFVVALSSPTRRRVADRLAGTVVIAAEALGTPVPLEVVPVAVAVPGAPVPGTAAAGAPPANWYPDPSGEKRLRWWDGQRWTDHTAE